MTQKTGFCIWLTGLPAAGKSTLAEALEKALPQQAFILDGDTMRAGLNRDLGFSAEDRAESARRVSEVARLMVDVGLVVIVALISPFRTDREMARLRIGQGRFIEVFVDTPITICEERDPKGLYRKARLGHLPNLTGVGSAYEAPLNPELRLIHDGSHPALQAQRVIAYLAERARILPDQS